MVEVHAYVLSSATDETEQDLVKLSRNTLVPLYYNIHKSFNVIDDLS